MRVAITCMHAHAQLFPLSHGKVRDRKQCCSGKSTFDLLNNNKHKSDLSPASHWLQPVSRIDWQLTDEQEKAKLTCSLKVMRVCVFDNVHVCACSTHLLPLVSYCFMFLMKWIFLVCRGLGEPPERFLTLQTHRRAQFSSGSQSE